MRAYALETSDPGAALGKLDRKIQYFEPGAMATVMYGLYTPATGEFAASSAGHLPPVLAAPGARAAVLPIPPDPPIGIADDPRRRATASVIPPGSLLFFFTDGLVERRDQAIDRGIDRVAATLDDMRTAGESGTFTTGPAAEDACAAVMRALVGQAPAPDDIAVLALHRHAPRA
ncbi:MAG: PP2C family protein-serine/threonine phosphatase [Trebonia sp.]